MRQTDFTGNPVLSLQTMLRTISFRYPIIPRLTPDGLFGERTLEAVMIFQREFFPPVTGQVNNATWNAIAALYRQVLQSLRAPRPATGFPNRDYTIEPWQPNVHINIIQSMFQSMSNILEQIEPNEVNGVLDETTQRNIRRIQRLNGAEESGVMDMAVWDTLSRLYTIFVTYAQTPWLTRPESLQSPS
ncbi:peptidoglycan-binding domain-containing protein [Lawsonibacter celer]|jgi:peptidoglycan hydrolase-like protein with peptidoglycan-binding domain|uniref:peptidoglycan-binding domain-containing protein n=1 Tax=Lawsonibacter celer TaxID=2986526 RepID=UPI0016442E27|nr:peptidoglycan-binding protein [Lawsonibacter celer]